MNESKGNRSFISKPIRRNLHTALGRDYSHLNGASHLTEELRAKPKEQIGFPVFQRSINRDIWEAINHSVCPILFEGKFASDSYFPKSSIDFLRKSDFRRTIGESMARQAICSESKRCWSQKMKKAQEKYEIIHEDPKITKETRQAKPKSFRISNSRDSGAQRGSENMKESTFDPKKALSILSEHKRAKSSQVHSRGSHSEMETKKKKAIFSRTNKKTIISPLDFGKIQLFHLPEF